MHADDQAHLAPSQSRLVDSVLQILQGDRTYCVSIPEYHYMVACFPEHWVTGQLRVIDRLRGTSAQLRQVLTC